MKKTSNRWSREEAIKMSKKAVLAKRLKKNNSTKHICIFIENRKKLRDEKDKWIFSILLSIMIGEIIGLILIII